MQLLSSALIIIYFFSLCVSANAESFCSSYKQPEAYKEYKKFYETKTTELSKQKDIATLADNTLSKLITAKSPIILNWLQKRNLLDKPEEFIASEWRTYYLQNFVLSSYPNESALVNQQLEKFVDEIIKKHLSTDYKNKIEKLFLKAKELALKNMESYKIANDKKAKDRIEKIKLYWPENLKTAKNKSIPLDIINWTLAYDPGANEINVGVNSLQYPNEETIITVLLHEIGHSIDSCRWGSFLEGPWPFEKVGNCLRTDKSANAKKRDDSKIDLLKKSGKSGEELALSLVKNPTCNKLGYPPIGLQSDQLPESFADWFATESIAKSQSLDFKNIRQDLCESQSLSPGSSYPENGLRLEKIYHAHPDIKKALSIKNDSVYCSFK